MPQPTYKRCSSCGKTKAAGDFYKSKRYGLQAYCKACSRAASRAHEKKKAARHQRAKAETFATELVAGVKKCADCGMTKNFEAFAPTPRGKYGRAAYCRPCMNVRARDNYNVQHAEKRCRRTRAWRAENLDYSRERAKAWNRAHPERVRASAQRRRTKALDAWTAEGDQYATTILGDPCSYCGGEAGGVDHIEPLHHGGIHAPENLTACCSRCNSAKRTKPLLHFLLDNRQRIGWPRSRWSG